MSIEIKTSERSNMATSSTDLDTAMKSLQDRIEQVLTEKSHHTEEPPTIKDSKTEKVDMKSGIFATRNEISLTNVNLPEIIEVYKEYLKSRKWSFEKSKSLQEINKLEINVESNTNIGCGGDFGNKKTFQEVNERIRLLKTTPVNSSYSLTDVIKPFEEISRTYIPLPNFDDSLEIIENDKNSNKNISPIEELINQSFPDNLKKNLQCVNTQTDSINENLFVVEDIKEIDEKSPSNQSETLEMMGKKLESFEKHLCLTKLENDNLHALNTQEILRKIWKQIEEIREELNGKISKMYSCDRKEKKILKNNIILNYQSITKMFAQCQNYEKQRQEDLAKQTQKFNEIQQTIQIKMQQDSDKYSPIFQGNDIAKFISKHVDFLPVVLMLVMYLITLILKH